MIGPSALALDPPPTARERKVQFKTIADVFQFTKATMPVDEPGSLGDDEYWAILAYMLKSSGRDLAGKKLDASVASSMTLRP